MDIDKIGQHWNIIWQTTIKHKLYTYFLRCTDFLWYKCLIFGLDDDLMHILHQDICSSNGKLLSSLFVII